jgi:hypothetical protein
VRQSALQGRGKLGLAAKQEPPLFFNLVWTDYTRMANEIAAAPVVRR